MRQGIIILKYLNKNKESKNLISESNEAFITNSLKNQSKQKQKSKYNDMMINC